MATPSLALYVDAQYASPYAMSVFVALQEKHLAFEMHTVNLGAGEQRAPGFAAVSLTQRVPTLVHDGFTLTESSAITEYIDDAFEGPRLYPHDRQQRAMARQVQAWLRSDLMALRQERSTEVVFYGLRKPPLTPAGSAAAAKLVTAASSILTPGASHLFGDWCVADLDLALMLNRLVMNGDALPAHLAAYATRQWARPSVQQWAGIQRPDL